MLLEFKISNFRSIGEEVVISFLPAPKQREFPSNIFHKEKQEALNAIAFYGANASGKSNLIKAMGELDRFIHLSARFSSTTKLPYDPFLLRSGWDKKPTRFEITFLSGDKRYRYGIEFFDYKVLSEWLYRKEVGREVPLFLREEEDIETFTSLKGNNKIIQAAIEATKPNGLFLSMCDTFNLEDATTIFNWFRHFSIIDGLAMEEKIPETFALLTDEKYKSKIEEFLLSFNLGIAGVDVRSKDFDLSDLPSEMNDQWRDLLSQQLNGKKGHSIEIKHQLYDENGKVTDQIVSWPMREKESAGTNDIVHLSGPVVWTLINGGILVIDEIEARKHTNLTLNLVEIFLNKTTNPHDAQLIFATHDTNLLTYPNLRRDQIYFVEKNNWESTEIYSLSDFRYMHGNGLKERPDADKEKRYLEGRYGAIPVINSKRVVQKILANGKE